MAGHAITTGVGKMVKFKKQATVNLQLAHSMGVFAEYHAPGGPRREQKIFIWKNKGEVLSARMRVCSFSGAVISTAAEGVKGINTSSRQSQTI